MIKRSTLKIPELPRSFGNRVFVGGSYDLCMPDLRKIGSYIREAG